MKNNFDDYIKGKLSQREFEFDEANWLNAASLLDQEDKDKRRGFFWLRYASAALLLFTLVGIGWYYTNTNNIGLSPKTVVNQKEEIPSHNKFEDQQKLSETSNETFNDLNERKTESKTVLQPSVATNQQNVNSRNLKALEKQPTFKNKQYNLFDKPITTNYTPLNTRKNNPVLQPKTNSEGLVNVKNILIDAISGRTNLIDFSTHDLTAKYLDESLLQNASTISAHSNKLQFALRTGILGIPKTFKNMSYSGGIVISYPISNRWIINLEGNFVNQYSEFTALKTAKRIMYTFGKNTYEDALTPDRLLSVEVPLYLSYRFGKQPYKHQFNFGGAVSRLLQVNGNVVSFYKTGDEIIDSGKISTNAFNSININGILGYEYQINKRFNIGLRARYNFTEIGDSKYDDINFYNQTKDVSKLNVELNTKIRLY